MLRRRSEVETLLYGFTAVVQIKVDLRRSELVWSGCNGDRAIGAAAAEDQALAWDDGWIGGSGGETERLERRIDIANGERQRADANTDGGVLVGNWRHGGVIIHKIGCWTARSHHRERERARGDEGTVRDGESDIGCAG